MSLNQILEIGRRSLLTFRSGLNTVSQNIANSESEGYHRRRITLSSAATDARGVVVPPPGPTDRLSGVDVGSFERLRDRVFTTMIREAETGFGAGEEEARLLDGVEGIFASGTDGSLTNTLSEFWDAWSDVADNPTDIGTREALLRRSENVAATFNSLDDDLNRLRGEAIGTLERGVAAVNEKLHRIAELNERITHAENAGSPNYSAADERDQLVREIAEHVPVKVLEDQQDGYQVSVNGMMVVQGKEVVELDVQDDTSVTPPNKEVAFKGTNKTFQPATNDRQDGKIGAWLRTINDTMPAIQGELDTLANDIVTQVNALHNAGYDLNGNAGGDFFDAAGTTAGTMTMDAAMTDPELIAAAAEDPANPGNSDGPGNSDQALAIFDLREGIENEAIRIVSDVGNRLDEAQKVASAQSGVLAQTEAMERGTSAVSTDEELTKMIEYQQSFSASSRIVQTAQEMMDTLLAM